MKTESLARVRATIVNEHVNLEKDFFSLSTKEQQIISYYKKVFNFNGRNNLGRSELRQFYYHLQNGYKKNIEKALKRYV